MFSQNRFLNGKFRFDIVEHDDNDRNERLNVNILFKVQFCNFIK